MTEPRCPRDGQPLRAEAAGGRSCDCGGVLVGVALLRRMIDRDTVNALWQAARSEQFRPGLGCPSGEHRMREAVLQPEQHPRLGGPVTLDVCLPCQHVWADTGEVDVLPLSPQDTRLALPERPKYVELPTARFGSSGGVRAATSGGLLELLGDLLGGLLREWLDA